MLLAIFFLKIFNNFIYDWETQMFTLSNEVQIPLLDGVRQYLSAFFKD